MTDRETDRTPELKNVKRSVQFALLPAVSYWEGVDLTLVSI